MFVYQKKIFIPLSEPCPEEVFFGAVRAAQTKWLVENLRMALDFAGRDADSWPKSFTDEYMKFLREQTAKPKVGKTFAQKTEQEKLQAYAKSLKDKLPAGLFQAKGFDLTLSEKAKEKVTDETTTEEIEAMKRPWVKQASVQLSGLCVLDIDHMESEELRVKSEEFAAADFPQKAQKLGIVLIYISPSGRGLKVVFKADAARGNLIDNQLWLAGILGVKADEGCKDASRRAYLTTEEDILFINKEELFHYENKEFAEKYDAEYRAGHSAATKVDAVAVEDVEQGTGNVGQMDAGKDVAIDADLQAVIDAWTKERFGDGSKQVSRHEASVSLARDLYIMLDRDARKTLSVLKAQPWVKAIIDERGEDVERTVKNAAAYVTAAEDEAAKKGRSWLPTLSKEMKAALEASGAVEAPQETSLNSQPSTLNSQNDDVYGILPLDAWAKELQEMAEFYPCLKQLFLNVHPHKLPAVWFSSAALFGTLMTRAFYHFWYEPEIVRRLNYSIFIIGDPGAGKNIVEKFYHMIAAPMVQADQCLIDAVNRYKEGRTERTTSSKAQKGDALKRPEVGIRVHPARTATGEFIRHMRAAVETVQGQQMNLHMFSFDAELDNVTKQNKGGDWKDREILELKAFHNEQDGQMYANQESVTGMFNIFWNFIYTGTPYALHRKVNQRNFGTGMATRLAVIPLPDKGVAKRHQQVDPDGNETLKTWAYRLDRVEGEIPIEPLNDETYEWQSARLEIAEFNGDRGDKMLLKRIPYYGIGISLPFILMRHWDEWQEKKTLTMDDRDCRLCHLAMEIQYKCQHFFFGEMAFNYFADQNKEFVQRRRTTRYDECFRKLPDEFKTHQFMDCFGCSQSSASRSIQRLIADGIVERVQHGLYRKILQELP